MTQKNADNQTAPGVPEKAPKQIDVPDDGPDGFELPDGTETWIGSVPETPTNYMGVDQYGNTYHNLGPHPRKALIEKTGYKHVSKMYVDGKEGETPWTHCIGYVVGPHWVTLYEVKRAIIQ